jgi:MFS transporter, AAHS family, 4-hydroxybenzoate transporter
LGAAFSAGLFGVMVGAMLFGQLADRIGRRPAFVAAVSILGVFTLVTPLANSILALSMFRFFSGLGIGGILAVIPSFISEFVPTRVRNSFEAWALSGIPLGGVLGAAVAASLVPLYGWKSVYLIGGMLTILLATVAFFTLPESPLFSLSHNKNETEALDILRRITGARTPTGMARTDSTATKKTTSAVHGVFGGGRLLMTLLFWLITCVLLMDFYFMVNWAPTLLLRGGFSAKIAALGSALLNIGGAVPGLGIGRFSDHWGGRRVMSTIFRRRCSKHGTGGCCVGFIRASDSNRRVGRYRFDRWPGCDAYAGSAELSR